MYLKLNNHHKASAMRKKMIFLVFICLHHAAMLCAQTDSLLPTYSQQQPAGSGGAGQDIALAQLRKDIVPHSPEAEAMAKYDVLPVTLYTGMPSISIPLYELKTPGLSIPFSLSY